MKKVLLWLWQLPQNILGLLVILVTRARYNDISSNKEENHYLSKRFNFGVCLGEYIILGRTANHVLSYISVEHEQGHRKQSRMLGPLYLLLIGLPSFTGNIYDRIAHRNWDFQSRYYWYYKQPWEAWADKLGGVKI